MTLLPLILIPLYAAADRMVGGAGRRSIAFAAVLLASIGLAWVLHLWPILVMGVTWIAYRSLPFDRAFGSTTPRTGGEIAATLFRHSIPALVALGCGADGLFGASWFRLAAWLAGYAVAATFAGLEYAHIVDDQKARGEPGGDENSFVEALRGLAYGAVLAAWVNF